MSYDQQHSSDIPTHSTYRLADEEEAPHVDNAVYVANPTPQAVEEDKDAIPEGDALEALLRQQYAADGGNGGGTNASQRNNEGGEGDDLPRYKYLDYNSGGDEERRGTGGGGGAADGGEAEGGIGLLSNDIEALGSAPMPIQTTRRPEDDKDLMKGEADLRVIQRLVAQFDALRREVQLPMMDTILLEKYILDPVDEAVEKSTAYYQRRRRAVEQLCRDMPAIAAAVAGSVEPDIEGVGGVGVGGELTVAELKAEVDLTVGPPPMAITRRRVVGSLVKLMNLLSDHKQATLEVLEAVGRREAALEDTMRLAAANEGGDLHDVEAAILIHKTLFEVQKASLVVVEKIKAWREGLCMPHPFMVSSGENYILKMFKDCGLLSEHLVIQKMLPMQHLFCDFPLFSNVPSISRYVVEKEATGGPYTPMGAPPLDLKLHKRLQEAEAYMHTEVELQLAMIRALLTMSTQRSEMLPILNISPVCPVLKQQQKEAAEKQQKAEARIKPLRMCVPVGASTVGAAPSGNATSATVDPNSSVGQAVLKFTRGIRVGSTSIKERYEATLLMYFEVLRDSSPSRDAYDKHCKEDHRHDTAGRTFKAMRTKSITVVNGVGGLRGGGVPASGGTPVSPPVSPSAAPQYHRASVQQRTASIAPRADDGLPSPSASYR